MRKFTTSLIAILAAVATTLFSACSAPTNPTDSNESIRESLSAIESESLSEIGSLESENNSSESQSESDSLSKKYKISSSQSAFSLKEEDVVQIKIKVTLDGVEVTSLDGLSFLSADPSVASVDQKGVLTALKIGKTTVTVSFENAKRTFAVTVEKLAKSVVLDKTAYSMPVNSSVQVLSEGYKSENKDANAVISYKIEDESIATIDENGLIFGNKKGETVLTATYQTASVRVPVVVYAETTAANVNSFDSTYVNSFGRAYVKWGNLSLEHVAAGVELAIVGSSLKMTAKATSKSYIRVFVDGSEIGERIQIDSEQSEITVATGLANDYHKIRIVKSTELFDDQISISSFAAEKFALPPSKGNIKIEFIGDSIAAGYGVLGRNGENRTKENSDGSLGFAYRTAQKLNADYSIVAAQGICAKVNQWRDDWTMYDLYPYKTVANDAYSQKKYDFSFNPDLIVLELGTNEATYISEKDRSYGLRFESDYADMLRLIRSENAAARIICVYGMMGENSEISEGIKNAIAEIGDERISYAAFQTGSSGVQSHPSVEEQNGFAESLASIIRDMFNI